MAIRILFICHGNICRSPMAEFYMRHLVDEHILVASAATSREEIGNDIHWGTREKLREKGIPFKAHQAVQVTQKDYNEYDYLIIMDENNRRNLARIVGPDRDYKVYKAMTFAGLNRDVKDPWYTGDFDATYDDVEQSCKGLLKWLLERRS